MLCPKCELDLSEDSFAKNRSRSTGLQLWCKPCKRAYDSAYYKADPKAQLARNSNVIARNREFVLQYLGDKVCVDCGEDDPVVLEFDHVDPLCKTRTISYLVSNSGCSIKKIMQEIAKCQIRCANCHRRKTAKQRGYYRSKEAIVPPA